MLLKFEIIWTGIGRQVIRLQKCYSTAQKLSFLRTQTNQM